MKSNDIHGEGGSANRLGGGYLRVSVCPDKVEGDIKMWTKSQTPNPDHPGSFHSNPMQNR